MLEIRAIMNSPVEDIFGFKTCCGFRAWRRPRQMKIQGHLLWRFMSKIGASAP